MSLWLALLLSLASLALFLYLSLYAYWTYRAYRVFSLYLDSPAIREEVQGRLSPFFPSFPLRLVQRIIELEMFYDFVYETGLDLSSVRRDYFRSLRTGVPVEVVSLYEPLEGP